MSNIISIVNQKGGTGKTTTAISLSAALAELAKKVLLVDLDPQANATSGLGIRLAENEGDIYKVFSGKTDLRSVLKKTSFENLYLIPATSELAGANIELVNQPEREFVFKKSLEELKDDFDFIFVDCPPSLGLLTVNALVVSDFVLIPVQCEYYALEGLGQLLSTIDLVKQNLQPNLGVLGALLTMHDKRTKLSQDVVNEVREKFPYRVFETFIPRNIRLSEAPSFGQPILKHAPWSKGARAYRRLAREIIMIYNEINNKAS